MSDITLVDIENGNIKWDEIKKLYDNNLDESVKKFHCKKCNCIFYSKNYLGEFPLCIKHRYKK